MDNKKDNQYYIKKMVDDVSFVTKHTVVYDTIKNDLPKLLVDLRMMCNI